MDLTGHLAAEKRKGKGKEGKERNDERQNTAVISCFYRNKFLVSALESDI